MSDYVYKRIDLVGTSRDSIEDAIRGAIDQASETTRNIDWFEVDEIRGWVKNGKPEHFQVTLKVGFRIDQDD